MCTQLSLLRLRAPAPRAPGHLAPLMPVLWVLRVHLLPTRAPDAAPSLPKSSPHPGSPVQLTPGRAGPLPATPHSTGASSPAPPSRPASLQACPPPRFPGHTPAPAAHPRGSSRTSLCACCSHSFVSGPLPHRSSLTLHSHPNPLSSLPPSSATLACPSSSESGRQFFLS